MVPSLKTEAILRARQRDVKDSFGNPVDGLTITGSLQGPAGENLPMTMGGPTSVYAPGVMHAE